MATSPNRQTTRVAKRPRNSRKRKTKISSEPRINTRIQGNGAETKRNTSVCPIVGVGGSAGGFEAAMELLRYLPVKNGMAFVIVQHLDPHHASRLASLLGKVTSMPVSEVTRTTKPEPNTVYVQPANKCVIIKNGLLTLIRRTERLNV